MESEVQSVESGEIIFYQPDGESKLQVFLEKDTVWLTQAQMGELFKRERSVIAKHIANAFKEEIEEKSNVQILHNTLSKFKPTTLYSLDVIISVGYRVKSVRGTQFRRWANQVLKEHLLRGGSVNCRLVAQENRLDVIDNRVLNLEKQVDFFVKKSQPPAEGVIPARSWWSGYEFAAQLVRSAKKEVVVVDPFGDDTALSLLSKRTDGVKGILYSARVTAVLKAEAERLNRQKPVVEHKSMREVHDRFIIVDEAIYHVGASIKDLGNKLTAFSVLSAVTKEQLLEFVK